MLFGGSRSGKTFLLCCALVLRALRAPGSRHAVIRRYANSARSAVGADTIVQVMRKRFNSTVPYSYNKSEGVFVFPNGSEIWLIGLDDGIQAEKILGKEFATIYFNECSELDYRSVQTALTRLAQNSPPLINRAFYDCNPPGKKHWSYKLFICKQNPENKTAVPCAEDYAAMQINPVDNAENLPENYISGTLNALPERERRRFLEGKFLDDIDGALWKSQDIERARVSQLPELERIVIGVDPAVTSGSGSDRTGIIAAGRGIDGEYYVLADRSMKGSPLEWASAVIGLYRQTGADRVIGEVNNGGELIEEVLRRVGGDISFRSVRATRGKILRAEPVAALYEKGKVHHVGDFPELEEEMTGFTPGGKYHSPDRLDALVWALTELSERDKEYILA